MKKILIGVLGLIFFVLINGCSRNADPQFRISNKQAEKVNVKIQTAAGSKFTINDIEPRQTTSYQTAAVGNITATAVIQNESISFLAAKNTNYTIVISTGKPPSVHVDQ
ncbi:MAG: hypothetical protein M0P61_00855 [Ignavibacteriaceae bacterium]|jgi:hypothetical protein|nr:hypothetical protein [Ignavibacteriaceae bacterium]